MHPGGGRRRIPRSDIRIGPGHTSRQDKLLLENRRDSAGKLCVVLIGGDDVAAPEAGDPALTLHGLAGLYDKKHAAIPLCEGEPGISFDILFINEL